MLKLDKISTATGFVKKFDEFLEYLRKNYFLDGSKFPPSMWSYFAQVSDFSDMETSTNSIERINLKLKRACPTGQITFHLGRVGKK